MEKGKQVWTVSLEKHRRLDLEVIAPTADAADESNVDDRQSTSGAAEAVTNDNLVVVQIDI